MTDLTPPVAWPPGWYHDPDGAELLRWWDGTAWTDRTVAPEELPAAGSPVPGPTATAPAPASLDRRPVGWGARFTLAATVGITLAALVVVLVHVVPVAFHDGSTATMTTAQTSSLPTTGSADSTASSTAPSIAAPSIAASTGTSPSVPVAASKPPVAHTFVDGSFSVPRGVPPGTYHTINHLDDCEWYRSAVVGGAATVVGQGIGDDGPAVATVLAGDVLFRSVDCGRWSSAPTGPAVPATQFDQGTFRVGVDVAPGKYSAAAPSGCVWRRLSAFTGTPGAVIAEGHPDDSTTVTISASDQGFYTIHCGTWRRA
jgi:hypothetical protein